MRSPLTEAHRQAQLAVRDDTLRRLTRLWPALNWQRLDATFPAFLDATLPLITTQRATSARLAADYFRRLRSAAGVDGPFALELADEVDRARLATSIRVTTLVAAKASASNGVSSDLALRRAFVLVSGAASRHVLDGGRETIRRTTLHDPKAHGWQRVTSRRACEFCRMLADRGAVYGEASADFASHDNCGCSAEPVFRD